MYDEPHIAAGFVTPAVYAIWLLIWPRLADDSQRARVKAWLISHEIEIMDRVVDTAVDQVFRWYEEEVGS